MSSDPLVKQIRIREGDGPKLMARVVGPRNTALNQAAVSAVSWRLFNLKSTTPGTAIDNGTLTVADVFFDSLQTSSDDPAWTEDATGYNFAYQFPADTFALTASGAGRYRLEIRGTPTTGEKFWIGVWIVEVVDVLTDVST